MKTRFFKNNLLRSFNKKRNCIFPFFSEAITGFLSTTRTKCVREFFLGSSNTWNFGKLRFGRLELAGFVLLSVFVIEHLFKIRISKWCDIFCTKYRFWFTRCTLHSPAVPIIQDFASNASKHRRNQALQRTCVCFFYVRAEAISPKWRRNKKKVAAAAEAALMHPSLRQQLASSRLPFDPHHAAL